MRRFQSHTTRITSPQNIRLDTARHRWFRGDAGPTWTGPSRHQPSDRPIRTGDPAWRLHPSRSRVAIRPALFLALRQLRQDLADHPSMHVGQPAVDAVVAVG
jgi:hypothetical protein